MPARKKPTIPDELLDQLLDGRNAQEAIHDGAFFDDLKKALADRILNAEMDHHLAGEDEAENVRNGFGFKTVATGGGGGVKLTAPNFDHPTPRVGCGE